MNEPNRSASIPVVRSVINALNVIEALSKRQPLSTAELARDLKLPKSTVFRALITLESCGWAESSAPPIAEWSLTNKVFELGLHAPRSSGPLDAAISALTALRDEFFETTSLLVPSADELVVIAREDGINAIRAFIELGTRVSFTTTASGRAYLSALPEQEVVRLLDLPINSEPLAPAKENVWREVALARQRGYAIDEGLDRLAPRPALIVQEATPATLTNGGVAGVAAAVLDAQAAVKGVISITMPTSSAKTVDLALMGERLAQVCRELSGRQ